MRLFHEPVYRRSNLDSITDFTSRRYNTVVTVSRRAKVIGTIALSFWHVVSTLSIRIVAAVITTNGPKSVVPF